MAKLQHDLDDCQSLSGSVLGGTLVSRHSQRGTLRNIDLVARKLREFHRNEVENEKKLQNVINLPSRCNTTFHHFRYVVVILAGVAIGFMMMMRYSMTVSILKMVNQTHMYLEEHPNRTVDDFLAEGYSLGGEFKWNNEIVSIILSWYMITYTIPQLPCTQLAMKIGCRWSILICLTICSISLLLTPWLAYWGWQYVVVMRLLNGLGASAMIPIILNIIEIWMRQDEVSLGLSMSQGFCNIFIMITPLISGYLSQLDWTYSFYVPGIIALVFSITWFVLVNDVPEESRFISEKEIQHILESNVYTSKQTTSRDDQKCSKSVSNQDEGLDQAPKSWLQLFKVPSFYAYIVAWTIYNCANHGYIFILPTYMRQFLKINVADNGFYGFIIAIGGIVPVFWPHILHKLLIRLGFSVTRSTNICQTVCCLGVTATWSYVGVFHQYQLFSFFMNRSFFGANDILFTTSLMSNYGKAGLSSEAYSIMNSISDILIVPSSTFIGWFLDYNSQSKQGWSLIFVTLGLSHVILWLIFVVFIDSDPIKFSNKQAAAYDDNLETEERNQVSQIPNKISDKTAH